MSKYDDIINLPHYVSTKRSRMSMSDRAAQFSPFRALAGYEDAVEETARPTSERIELSEDARELLGEKLRLLEDTAPNSPAVKITYFQPDDRKAGGTYTAAAGLVKKIDGFKRIIVMQNGLKIAIEDIIDIEWSK